MIGATSSNVAAGVASGPRSATTVVDELARLDQALVDLAACGASSVNLIHCPTAARERTLVRALARRSRERGFVTATLSLREHSPDTPDDLLREILEGLIPPDDARPRGVLYLLDLYIERHGKRAAERFDDGCAAESAHGDLVALCRGYLQTPDEHAVRETRAYESWLNGTEAAKRNRNPEVRRALSERTAQRALGELSRVLRALGYRGLVVFLSEGDAVASRTSRQREKAYTIFRELVDNFDGADGAVATRIVITGTEKLFEGPRSLRTVAPLLMRLDVPSDAEPPPPHRSWTSLVREPYEYIHRRVTQPPENRLAALRNLVRISEGLPPTEAVTSMSVGHDRIERTIDRLFHHMELAGSVFTVLVGEYGSGKTHLMMHLAERALGEGRPVFWLNLERMNLDLSSPPRHLARLLEHSTLPVPRRPSARERAAFWTRSSARLRRLVDALTEVAATETEEAHAAQKALQIQEHAADPGHALENFLAGSDLESRGAGKGYRRDAYRRLLLWIELLRRLEGTTGAVVLIDEAENLYTSGVSEAGRRSALRTLSFYCGGALPGTCVVMAMTPPAFSRMAKEAGQLLREADEMASTLDLEDVALFRRRLRQLDPQPVPALSGPQRAELVERVRRTHRTVRGPVEVPEWEALSRKLVREHPSPRTLVRALVDHLESAWWAGSR